MPLDIGIGLILGVLLSSLSGISYTTSLVIGVIACLLPDLDFIWPNIRGSYSYKKSHRDGLHYPLLFIPIVAVLGSVVDPYIGLALGIGSLLHFVHDSIGVGWGVKWLFPIDNKSYAFLYRAGLEAEKGMPKKLVYVWTDEQRDKDMNKYADPKWIKHIYLQPHPYGIFEYIVLVVGVIVAFAK